MFRIIQSIFTLVILSCGSHAFGRNGSYQVQYIASDDCSAYRCIAAPINYPDRRFMGPWGDSVTSSR